MLRCYDDCEIELLRVGLGQLHTRPRLQRGIGISAEPTATTNISDTKLAFHDKPHRYYNVTFGTMYI